MRETNAPGSIAGSGTLTARDFVQPLFRRKRLLVTVAFLVFAAVILISLLLGPSYASHMEILVNQERLDPVVSTQATTQMVTGTASVTPEEINSEVDLLSSGDVLQQVVLQNNLWQPKGSSILDMLRKRTDQERIERATQRLAKQLKIANVRNSNLIEVNYSSPDPQLSRNVLHSLADLYLAKHAAVHRPAGSFEFFAQETQKYRNELTDANAKLRAFGKESAVAAPDEERTQLASQYASSIGSLHGAEQAIAGDEARLRDDLRQLNNTQPRSTTQRSTAINDKLIDDLTTALVAAQTKRTQLALKYEASYPLVQEADQEIAQDKAALQRAEETKYTSETTDRDPTYELIREDLARSQADLTAQRAVRDATHRSLDSIQADMVRLDQAALQQQDLQREAKAAEENYLLYMGKREQERSSNALDQTRISNVALAVPPLVPVLPTRSWFLTVLAALGLAVISGVGSAYAADYFDTALNTPAQVSDALGIPVVISIARKVA